MGNFRTINVAQDAHMEEDWRLEAFNHNRMQVSSILAKN
jgi:hypothetical protein